MLLLVAEYVFFYAFFYIFCFSLFCLLSQYCIPPCVNGHMLTGSLSVLATFRAGCKNVNLKLNNT